MTPEIRRVLAVKPSSMGDIFHVFPALQVLHEAYPAARLDYLVHPAFSEILDFSPWKVSRKIFFNRAALGKFRSFAPEFIKLLMELRRRRYDLIIDFQGLFRSAFFAAVAPGPLPQGFADPREKLARLFYARRTVVGPGHAVERNLALANRICGIDHPVPVLRLPEISRYAAPVAAALAAAGATPETPLLGVIAGARWDSKRFPAAWFAETLRRVVAVAPEVRPVLIGAPSERREVGNLTDFPGAIDLIGRTSPGEMVELLRRCRAVLCNDSGPMHAAAAVGIPTVACFGSTDWRRTGPYGDGHRILTAGAVCSPCLKRSCPHPPPACWGIAPETAAAEVLAAIG